MVFFDKIQELKMAGIIESFIITHLFPDIIWA